MTSRKNVNLCVFNSIGAELAVVVRRAEHMDCMVLVELVRLDMDSVDSDTVMRMDYDMVA